MKALKVIKDKWREVAIVFLLLSVVFNIPGISLADMMHIQPTTTGLWEVSGNETQLITADELDIQNRSILNVLDIDGVAIGILSTTISTHTTAIAGLDTRLTTAEGDISDLQGDVTSLKSIAIIYVIDGGGSAITTGQKGHLDIPFDCTITTWTLLGDQSGSIVIDVWNDIYANFPPTVVDTIAGSEKPTLSGALKNQDLALSTWTTAVSAGDILAFNVDSVSTVERITLSIRATKT